MTNHSPDRHPDDYPPAALITGAARRVGRVIAAELAKDGWAVAIHHNRSAAEAESLCKEIEAAGGRAVALRADLAQESEAETLVPRAVEDIGPLGLLVNNAAVFEMDRPSSATRATWDLHIETNLRAPFALTQAFARQRPAESGGLVINILDERVLKPTPNYLTYTIAKSGLWTATRAFALALAPHIRVNGIGPGYTLPEAGQTREEFERKAGRMLLGRGTDPMEICAAIRFLIAVKSVTGQMIALDGGQHMGWLSPGALDEG